MSRIEHPLLLYLKLFSQPRTIPVLILSFSHITAETIQEKHHGQEITKNLKYDTCHRVKYFYFFIKKIIYVNYLMHFGNSKNITN